MIKSPVDSSIYTDFTGLQKMRANSKGKAQGETLQKVAQQFEAIFLQHALKSMRQANKPFQSDLLHSNQTEFYQDLYDKQITMHLSKSGAGLAEVIVNQLQKTQGQSTTPSGGKQVDLPSPFGDMPVAQLKVLFARNQQQSDTVAVDNVKSTKPIALPQDILDKLSQNVNAIVKDKKSFLQGLYHSAKAASKILGIDPRFLLAQAALETAWGKRIITSKDGQTSFNLFGIKADSSWQKDKVNITTTEYRNGKRQKEVAAFRQYGSFAESFKDYVNFLQDNPRYKNALQNTSDVKTFANELQRAGYATDPNYAKKILRIMRSLPFRQVFGF